jgi:hypothetical protein
MLDAQERVQQRRVTDTAAGIVAVASVGVALSAMADGSNTFEATGPLVIAAIGALAAIVVVRRGRNFLAWVLLSSGVLVTMWHSHVNIAEGFAAPTYATLLVVLASMVMR